MKQVFVAMPLRTTWIQVRKKDNKVINRNNIIFTIYYIKINILLLYSLLLTSFAFHVFEI